MSSDSEDIIEALVSTDRTWQVPSSVDSSTHKSLLRWVGDNKINNLKLISGYPPFIEKGKGFYPIEQRALDYAELTAMYNGMLGTESAENELAEGVVKDFQYYLPPSDSGQNYGFRVCATSCRPKLDSKSGIEMMLRVVPGAPPDLEWNKLEKPLEKALIRQGGLIMVVGTTSSGKTTLLASTLRHVCTTTNLNGYSIENPCEYDFSQIEDAKVPIVQFEVGHNIDSYRDALPMLLRKTPHFAFYGEARDLDSITQMANAADTGMTVYTTLHADSVREALPRLVRSFDTPSQPLILEQLLTQTRLIVFQRLLKREDGTLTAVREYVVLSQADRIAAKKVGLAGLSSFIGKLQVERGTDYKSGLSFLRRNGEISQDLYESESLTVVR